MDACADVMANALDELRRVAEESFEQIDRAEPVFLDTLLMWTLSFQSRERLGSVMVPCLACNCWLRPYNRLHQFHTHRDRRMTEEEATVHIQRFTTYLFHILDGLSLRLPAPIRALTSNEPTPISSRYQPVPFSTQSELISTLARVQLGRSALCLRLLGGLACSLALVFRCK